MALSLTMALGPFRARLPSRLALLLLGLLFFAAAPAAYGQAAGRIEGRVVNAETGAPLPGVNVSLEGTSRGASTGTDGTFAIDTVAPDRYTVVASFVGYKRARRPIRVRASETTRLDVQLSAQASALSEVVVLGRRGTFVPSDASRFSKAGTALLETPQSVSILSDRQLQLQGVERLSEALRYAPGVQGEAFGFEPRLTFMRFRGFDATTAGLYRDGLQLRNPSFAIGYSPEPYGAERIEVARGPASVLYGAGSPGGLINVVSKRPTAQPLGELTFETGSYGRLEGRVDVGGPLGSDRVRYRLTGLVRESGTQIDYVGNDRLFAAPALTFEPTATTTLTVLGQYQRDATRSSQRLPTAGTLTPSPTGGQIPVDRYLGEPNVDRYDRTQRSVGYLIDQQVVDRLQLRQKLRHYVVDLDDVTVYGSALQDDGRTLDRYVFESFGRLDGLALDNQVQLDVGTGRMVQTLLAGLDYQQLDVNSEQNFGTAPAIDVFDPEYGTDVADPAPFADRATDQRQVGVYLQDRIDIGRRVIVTLNGRYDWARTETRDRLSATRTEQHDRAFSGRAGVVYRSRVGMAPYASYSESFLPAIGTDVDGAPFVPERGRQYEVGLKYQPDAVNSFLTVALYDLTRRNFLQSDPETFQQVQTGDANTQGLELEGVAALDFGLDVKASLTLQDVEITESIVSGEVGERPTQVRERMAALWAGYTVDRGVLRGLGVGGGVRYLGPSFGDVPNTLQAPAATIADAVLYYGWRGFRLQVNADNVFDHQYVASTFVSGPQGFATYGTERTTSVSLSYRW